uniref:Uncharacterized protein n=1 Tax=Bionectria ochroleuca TaxID=29856 RepID=A0A8H7K4D6_BIOOC
MSVPQPGPARRGSPVTTNYRGVTSPVQQYGSHRPPEANQASQLWRGPSPAPGFRPASPARLDYQSPRSSQQRLVRERPRPGPGHTRSQSAIVPSSTGYMAGSSQRPKVPAISVNGPQSRPASFHTTTSSMDQRSNGVYLQQKPPRQPVQQATRSGEWVPGVIPRQNLQQSHAQFMALEKEFQNLVKSSSPNHSRHDSFDSAISTRSSYSRPSSATSQASSGPADTKDAPLHGARRNYTSSPLAKPTRPSVDTTASSNGTTHINGPPTTAIPTSKKHMRGRAKVRGFDGCYR